MRPCLSVLGLTALLALPLLAEEAPKPQPPRPTPQDRLAADPNDLKGLANLRRERLNPVADLIEQGKLDAAEKALGEFKILLETLKPDEEKAKTQLEQSLETVASYQDAIDVARVSLVELEKRLDADPDDFAAVVRYGKKVVEVFYTIVQDDLPRAEALVNGAKRRLARVGEEAEEDMVKRKAASALKSVKTLDKRIEEYRRNLELVGQDAAPLHEELEAWVNGDPLTDKDLRGKVVILDFWAIWCRPCIATFPHLREWNEKYGGKGLVIIGLTRYYDYEWDEADDRPAKAEDEISADQEHEMLRRFAEHHSLRHRFAVQKEDGSLKDHYNVNSIPHVVVIDQLGKIRLIRVGSEAKNAELIDALLAELLGDKAASAAAEK